MMEFSAIATSELPPDATHEHAVRESVLRLLGADERVCWNALTGGRHCLGLKGFPGRGLRHVFRRDGKWLAWNATWL